MEFSKSAVSFALPSLSIIAWRLAVKTLVIRTCLRDPSLVFRYDYDTWEHRPISDCFPDLIGCGWKFRTALLHWRNTRNKAISTASFSPKSALPAFRLGLNPSPLVLSGSRPFEGQQNSTHLDKGDAMYLKKDHTGTESANMYLTRHTGYPRNPKFR